MLTLRVKNNEATIVLQNRINQDALMYVAWSRVWSPLVEAQWRTQAMELLTQQLPSDWEEHYWNTFHFANPQPPVPLLLHCTLHQDGNRLREEFARLASHLQMQASDNLLPPDHLASVCELLARAVEAEEELVISKVTQSYLLPWCDFAVEKLKAIGLEPLIVLIDQFADDLN